MKILLFADSHGKVDTMRQIISREDRLNLVIHLGDFDKDAEILNGEFPEIEFEIIPGNNDSRGRFSSEKILYLEETKILITHGHTYGVKRDRETLKLKARQLRVDAVFYAHTHIPEEMYADQILILNPGSIEYPLEGNAKTYCLITIEKRDIQVKTMSV